MADKSKIEDELSVLATPDGIQKYIFGVKKNGQPRAVYDIIRDYTKPKKKKKKDKKSGANMYSFYVDTKKSKKKKKDKKKHWHI